MKNQPQLANVLQRSLRVNLQNLGAGLGSVETVWVPSIAILITGPITVAFREATAGIGGGSPANILVRRTTDANAISEAVINGNQVAGTIFIAQNYGLASPRVAAGAEIVLVLGQIAPANVGRATVFIPWRPLVD